MKVLVTGGLGFIGSHLVDALVRDGLKVDVVDNLSNGHMENGNVNATNHLYDIATDRGKIKRLFKENRYSYVFHLAAMAKIPECVEKPILSFEVNVASTLHLLQLAREWGAGFIFSSSSSVYGEPESQEPIYETAKTKPLNLYGVQKLSAEQIVLMYAKFYGVRSAALRYFNVYGTARQRAGGAYPNVFSSFARDVKKGKITIYGDGKQQRDFVHVYDVVKANMRFLEISDAWGLAYNIGTGETHTINEVADYFHVPREYLPMRAGDPLYSCASMRLAQEKLKFKADISFKEGVDIYLRSFDNGDDDKRT